MHENGMSIKIALEESSSASIKKAVIENQCLAVISVRLVEEEVKNRKVYVICNADHDWNRFFSIVYHKNKVITEEMKNLVEVVKNY